MKLDKMMNTSKRNKRELLKQRPIDQVKSKKRKKKQIDDLERDR